MTQPKLKAVLFDMDDTLIDWSAFAADWRDLERKHLRCVVDYLAAQKRPLEAEFDDLLSDFSERVMEAWSDARGSLRAPHLGRILMQSLQEFGFMPDERIAMNECLTAYEWSAIPGVRVFPDVPPMLDQLVQRGITIGIVTNAFQPMTLRDVELADYDLLKFFPDANLRISAADVGYLKPHPVIFETALTRVAARPEEVVFVGDNPVADVSGAQQAGIRAVLRTTNRNHTHVSDLIKPDAAITSLAELPPLLDQWFGAW